MLMTIRQAIVECYRALHAAGVYHNDVGTRNWLRANDGTFRIIDFEKSTLFSQVDKNYWEYWKGMEMDRVAAVLQLD
jgi:tRNA A-37 threonylcarbamoyl transferase component Bud32